MNGDDGDGILGDLGPKGYEGPPGIEGRPRGTRMR